MKTLSYILVSLRPKHWIKNLFIFAAPFFSLKLFNPDSISRLLWGFLCWCAMTSAMYLFNDIADRQNDYLHPLKKKRPLASGSLSLSAAYVSWVTLALFAVVISVRFNSGFSGILFLYFLVNILYSLVLKNIFIVDVMCVSLGFILRVVSGAILINVGLSEWIIMCTLLLSLLLGFGKRQEEITLLEDMAVNHRKSLKEYDASFLGHIPYVLVSSTIVCYMLYTVSSEAVRKFSTKNLIYTSPFVIYGLFRYVYIAYEKKKGADPTAVLFQDVPTVINIVLWIIVTGLIIYVR